MENNFEIPDHTYCRKWLSQWIVAGDFEGNPGIQTCYLYNSNPTALASGIWKSLKVNEEPNHPIFHLGESHKTF